jgi:hypothetical protein
MKWIDVVTNARRHRRRRIPSSYGKRAAPITPALSPS